VCGTAWGTNLRRARYKVAMKRFLRIGLCLMLSSLPLAALQAQPQSCGDGIRAAQGTCTCCPDPETCCCEMGRSNSPAPVPDHAAVPVPTHAPDAATLAPVTWLVSTPATLQVVTTDTQAVLVHPEKSLARLHVLQI
jgi:hypothetical protein